MRITEVEIFGIEYSLRASGLPMAPTRETIEDLESSMDRGKRLGKAKTGSGHDCYLKGITVLMTLEASLKWFDQFARYSFQDVISSTSQMHKLVEMDIEEAFKDQVDKVILSRLVELRRVYLENPTKENYENFLYSVPQGILYTRAITTNYLQLKTMYLQRKNHKLSEWREFCGFLESLPYFLELIGE